MRHTFLLLSLIMASTAFADPVYQSKDRYGHSVFSDRPPAQPHVEREINVINDYRWQIPKKTLTPLKKKKHKGRKRRATSKKKKLGFLELKRKCDQARSRYQNYRGKNSNTDWASYKAKVAKYAEKRDYWCSRYLRRR